MSTALVVLGLVLIALLWLGWSFVTSGIVRDVVMPTCSAATRRRLRAARHTRPWS
jgi:hypothetical protein